MKFFLRSYSVFFTMLLICCTFSSMYALMKKIQNERFLRPYHGAVMSTQAGGDFEFNRWRWSYKAKDHDGKDLTSSITVTENTLTIGSCRKLFR